MTALMEKVKGFVWKNNPAVDALMCWKRAGDAAAVGRRGIGGESFV